MGLYAIVQTEQCIANNCKRLLLGIYIYIYLFSPAHHALKSSLDTGSMYYGCIQNDEIIIDIDFELLYHLMPFFFFDIVEAHDIFMSIEIAEIKSISICQTHPFPYGNVCIFFSLSLLLSLFLFFCLFCCYSLFFLYSLQKDILCD